MAARKYSVAEIDRMRKAISLIDREGGAALAEALRQEDRLRTYMMNGTEPEELVKVVEERWKCPIARIKGPQWP